MRKFSIKVNGKSYEVEVEETAGGAVSSGPVMEGVAPAPAPKAAPAPAPAPAAKPAPAGGTPLNSPMPGLILKFLVADGATVKKGDKVLILEAMKMENDILAPESGKVTFVKKVGDTVESGEVLFTVS